MSDVSFIAGWGGYLALKSGANTISLPMLAGSAYAQNEATSVEMLAQGNAQNAYAVNYTPGIKTSQLSVATRAIPAWFTAANLNAMFVTRDSNGDFGVSGAKFGDGATLYQDYLKPAGIRIGCAAASMGPIDVGLSFLGTAQTPVVGDQPGAYVAATGTAAYSYRDITIKQGTSTLTQVESFDLALSTGAHYALWFGATSTASYIDPGILTGALTLTQRAGATILAHASATCKISIVFGSGPTITVSCVRVSVGNPINVGGAVSIPSSWAIVSTDAAAPVVIA